MFKYFLVTIVFSAGIFSELGHALSVKPTLQEISMDKRKERIISVFNGLNKDSMSILDTFYHPELSFQDPVGTVHGLDSMKKYYLNMYKNVKSIRFEFSKILKDGSEYVGFWKMYLKVPDLNGGEEFAFEGNSHIRFDESTDLVIYHRDYFDMGDFIYERIPVLKNLIQFIKKKLAH